MTLKMLGRWTYKDVCDIEDHINMERFEITGTYVRVKEKNT